MASHFLFLLPSLLLFPPPLLSSPLLSYLSSPPLHRASGRTDGTLTLSVPAVLAIIVINAHTHSLSFHSKLFHGYIVTENTLLFVAVYIIRLLILIVHFEISTNENRLVLLATLILFPSFSQVLANWGSLEQGKATPHTPWTSQPANN